MDSIFDVHATQPSWSDARLPDVGMLHKLRSDSRFGCNYVLCLRNVDTLDGDGLVEKLFNGKEGE